MSLKKKLLITLSTVVAVVALVATSILGTVAYMTSSAYVSNSFTVGNVQISITEGLVGTDGQLKDGGTTRTNQNTYHLIPGKTYDKDPRIEVHEDTEPCYLFVTLKNGIAAIEDPDQDTMRKQMENNGWSYYKTTSVGTDVFVYRGTELGESALVAQAVCGTKRATSMTNGEGIVSATNIKVFEKFHLRTTITTDGNFKDYESATVIVYAFGIQVSGFGDLGSQAAIDSAWKAVVERFTFIQDNVAAP